MKKRECKINLQTGNFFKKPLGTSWGRAFWVFGLILSTFFAPCAGEALESCGAENISGHKLLVAYDTKHGSTVDIVLAVGSVLCSEGFQVDMQLVQDAVNIASYDGIIIASPIYWATFLPGALSFLETNRAVLATKSVSFFVLSTNVDPETGLIADGSKEFFVDPVLEQYPEIVPVGEVGLFPGKIFMDEMYPMEYIALNLSGYTDVGDLRNYMVVINWARSIADLL